VVNIQFSMFGVWSLNHLYRIPPFELWGEVGGHLGNCHKQQKRGGNFWFLSPSYLLLWIKHLTYVYPYPQTGEHPQYANSGNQGY
jgi:hypothetical protein